MTRHMPLLRLGQRLRLAPGGSLYRVERVNACAAYIRQVYASPKRVELPDGRTFEATQSSDVLPISPRAAVYLED